MTLDGHLKSGLSGSISLIFIVMSFYPGVEISILLSLVIGFLVGNVFPDFSELRIIPHRTFTHYWPFYAVPLFFFLGNLDLVLFSAYWALLAGLCGGSLLHIVCDWPYYGGVPLLSPRRKVALFRLEFDGVLNRVIEHTLMFFLIAIAAIVSCEEFTLFEAVNPKGLFN